MSQSQITQLQPQAKTKFIFFDRFSAIKTFTTNTFSNIETDNIICLINIIESKSDLSFFQIIPKKFTITTNTGSCNFIVDMIILASPIIKKAIYDKPDQLQYHLDINDDTNILQKFELLFEFENVIIKKDEFPIFHQIAEMLQIEDCFSNKKSNFSENLFLLTNNSQLQYRLNFKCFSNYLKLNEHKTFIISIKNKKYNCNKFGILTSSILADLITKDSKLNHYKYDYNDEFNNFQTICDFFNFDKITITQNNAEYIKEIAEDLKIDCLIKQVDNFYSKLYKISEKIDDNQIINESVDFLFDLLYNIKENTVKKVFDSIIISEWVKTIEDVQELAAFFIHVIKTDSTILHPYLIDLLEKLRSLSINSEEKEQHDNLKILIPLIIKKLMNSFGESNSNCSFVYILYKKKFIKLDEIIKVMKKTLSNCDNIHYICIYTWFLPELIDNDLYYKYKKQTGNMRNTRNFLINKPTNIDSTKNSTKSNNSNNTKELHFSSFITLGNLNIFKIGERFMPNFELFYGKSILYAVLNNYPKIIKYILSKGSDMIKNKDINSEKVNAICHSLSLNSLEIFDYLMDYFQYYENVDLALIQDYFTILDSAISNKRIEVVKKIVSFIYDKQDFTMQFINSLQYGSTEICHYFIDQKLLLNYEKIASTSRCLFLDEKIFSVIFDTYICAYE